MTDMTPREAVEVVQAELGGMCCESIGCTECTVKRQALATLSALADWTEEVVAVMEESGCDVPKPRWIPAGTRPPLGYRLIAFPPPPAAPGASHAD